MLFHIGECYFMVSFHHSHTSFRMPQCNNLQEFFSHDSWLHTLPLTRQTCDCIRSTSLMRVTPLVQIWKLHELLIYTVNITELFSESFLSTKFCVIMNKDVHFAILAVFWRFKRHFLLSMHEQYLTSKCRLNSQKTTVRQTRSCTHHG